MVLIWGVLFYLKEQTQTPSSLHVLLRKPSLGVDVVTSSVSAS